MPGVRIAAYNACVSLSDIVVGLGIIMVVLTVSVHATYAVA